MKCLVCSLYIPVIFCGICESAENVDDPASLNFGAGLIFKVLMKLLYGLVL